MFLSVYKCLFDMAYYIFKKIWR